MEKNGTDMKDENNNLLENALRSLDRIDPSPGFHKRVVAEIYHQSLLRRSERLFTRVKYLLMLCTAISLSLFVLILLKLDFSILFENLSWESIKFPLLYLFAGFLLLFSFDRFLQRRMYRTMVVP